MHAHLWISMWLDTNASQQAGNIVSCQPLLSSWREVSWLTADKSQPRGFQLRNQWKIHGWCCNNVYLFICLSPFLSVLGLLLFCVFFLKSGGRNLYLQPRAWSSGWNSSQQLRHTTAGCWIINKEVVSRAFCGLPTSICLDGKINLGRLLLYSRLRKITYRSRRWSDKRANSFCTPTH